MNLLQLCEMSDDETKDFYKKWAKDIAQQVKEQSDKTQQENRREYEERIRLQLEKDKDKLLKSTIKMLSASQTDNDEESNKKD
jgi:hypothetical protein